MIYLESLRKSLFAVHLSLDLLGLDLYETAIYSLIELFVVTILHKDIFKVNKNFFGLCDIFLF